MKQVGLDGIILIGLEMGGRLGAIRPTIKIAIDSLRKKMMLRSEGQMAIRRVKLDNLTTAFKKIGVGTEERHFEGMPYSSLIAYINYGYRGQRQIVINIKDDGECDVYLSGIHTLPANSRGGDVDFGKAPLLFNVPATSMDESSEIVSRIQKASVIDSTMVEATVFEKPPLPTPFDKMQTVADLIDAHKADESMTLYKDVLLYVLRKTGEVQHGDEEWSVLNEWITYSHLAPGSAIPRHPDGQPVIYQSASNLRLAPFIADFKGL